MFRNAVRPHAFIAFDKKIIDFGLPPGAAHPTQAVGDDVIRLDQLVAEQRNQRQQNTGWITAGARDQSCAGNFVAINLRQSVDRVAQEAGCAVFVRVKLEVSCGIFDSEIGAEIDDPHAGLQKRARKIDCDAMRQSEKRDLDFCRDFFRRGVGEPQRSGGRMQTSTRKNFGHGFARGLARSYRHQLRPRMTQKQAHQLLARITGRAKNCDLG